MALRIEKIRFNSWGCFEDHPIEFSGLGKVDLIYGENATGKSTTGRGMHSLLFGIDPRTADNHTFHYSELQIDARLLIDGEPVELSRVKKPSAPLLDVEGNSLLADPIPAGLGGVGEQVYSALFHVDKDTLDEGAEALLRGRGEVAESIFAAAAGIRSLHETLAALDAEAQEIYNPPRGRKGMLESATRELRECEKRLRATTLRPQRHAALRRELRKAEERGSEMAAKIRELEEKMRTTERRRTIAPLLLTHAKLSTELAPLAGTPALSPEAPAERSSAQARLKSGETQLGRARQDLDALEAQIDDVEVEEGLLTSAEPITAAKNEVSAIEKAGKDRRKLEGELHSAKASLEAAARSAGVPAAEVTSAPLSPAVSKALDSAVAGHEEITTRLAGAQSRLTKSVKARDLADEALKALPAAREIGGLEAGLGAAQGASALADRAPALTADHQAKAAAAERAFERLSPRPDALSGLTGLKLPSAEEAARAAAERAEITDLSRALASEEAAIAKRGIELEEEGNRLGAEGEALSLEELSEARERREGSWEAIRQGGEAGERLETEAAEEFEASLGATDQLADRRAEAGERLGRAAAHAAAQMRYLREADDVKSRRRGLDRREKATGAAWSALWEKSGLGPLGADSAPAWLEARDRVLDLAADAERAASEATAADEREEAHSVSLRDELTALEGPPKESLTLSALCLRASKLIEEERERTAARVGLETELRRSEEAVVEATEEQSLAEEALASWQEEWPVRLKSTGLPGATVPAEAQELVRAMREASGHREEIDNLERRIAGIDADRERFSTVVTALCERLAPELVELDAEAAATALHGRLAEHEKRAERLAGLRERREDCAKAIAAAEDEIAGANVALEALLSAAGITDLAELPALERRSERARSLAEEIAGLERQVVEAGEAEFAALLAEAGDFDRDADAAELVELEEQVNDLRAGRDELREEIVDQRRKLDEVETDTEAIRAREDVELALSKVEAAAIAYSRARLAATVVRRAIERYRRENESPMLARAKELFGSFARKTYSDLYVEVEDDGAAILVGRQYDGALKRVEQMSKGTREQLYLALRIAAIERYVESNGPVPVTFDDVFSESDEPRSERIFKALGELAERTQVTVLTHHRHLMALGDRALGDSLVPQELPGVAPSLRVAEAA